MQIKNRFVVTKFAAQDVDVSGPMLVRMDDDTIPATQKRVLTVRATNIYVQRFGASKTNAGSSGNCARTCFPDDFLVEGQDTGATKLPHSFWFLVAAEPPTMTPVAIGVVVIVVTVVVVTVSAVVAYEPAAAMTSEAATAAMSETTAVGETATPPPPPPCASAGIENAPIASAASTPMPAFFHVFMLRLLTKFDG
jgi:hypothetical protein